MSKPIDPENFTSSAPVDLKHATPARSSHVKRGEEFLSGPIPLCWLKQAASLRGKALAVGLAVWFKVRVTKHNSVKGSQSLWSKLGINRKSAYRALWALECAELIFIERHSGRCPVVTIRSAPKTKSDPRIAASARSTVEE